jgi:hypothetical protein
MSSHSEIPSASDAQAGQQSGVASRVGTYGRSRPRNPPDLWTSPFIGMADFHIFVWKGKQYLINIDNEVWQCVDGGFGKWAGIFKLMEGGQGWYIDHSVPEPVWED